MQGNQPRLFEIEAVNIYPKPFLKWAGGKSQLLPQLTPFFPKHFERYSEPFTGGAAVYWQLFTLRKQGLIRFSTARLADSNAELINCYAAVRDNVDELVDLLTRHRERHSKDYYYSIRSLQVENLSPVERAARFIYLNKTCYNGLYRVNRSGQFNVPMGSYANPRIFEEAEIRSASLALQEVELKTADFREILAWAQAGDFIYFDPPYAPLSKTSSFTSYTETPFGEEEQRALASIFRELDHRGCKLMLSNSWVDYILELYQDFNCIAVEASRAINSNPEGRGKIRELLVLNYEA